MLNFIHMVIEANYTSFSSSALCIQRAPDAFNPEGNTAFNRLERNTSTSFYNFKYKLSVFFTST